MPTPTQIPSAPAKPAPTGGPAGWEHRALYEAVKKTLFALPEEFTSSLVIRDFRATDIFTLNSALGASIEDSVVTSLNRLREVWDPDGKYSVYKFERQAQAFPDVRLVTDAEGLPSPLMGIELKGWFAMAKEGEPTFRYTVTADACAPQDLLVVFPWVLSDVVAGSPKLLTPFVGEAKYAAQLRNYHWQTVRLAKGGNAGITVATHRTPYPAQKADQSSDRADGDGSGNFGRIARYGLLDTFVVATVKHLVSGIPVKAWLKFFTVFSDNNRETEQVSIDVERAFRIELLESQEQKDTIVRVLEMLASKLQDTPVKQSAAAVASVASGKVAK
ncbi:hypothetical protein [Variovorax sp. W2I14]|uniref:hypothetical protein n=1 Tax=Variovorax sp. W2I14 TaxID=3042290 RepID=UPI003D1F3E6C